MHKHPTVGGSMLLSVCPGSIVTLALWFNDRATHTRTLDEFWTMPRCAYHTVAAISTMRWMYTVFTYTHPAPCWYITRQKYSSSCMLYAAALFCFFSLFKLPSWCLNLWSGHSANMSPIIVYWCEEKQYSVIPRKCVISLSSLNSSRGTCCWAWWWKIRCGYFENGR